MSGDQSVIDAILRRDLSSFIAKCFGTIAPAQHYHANWHIEAIAWHLQQCLDGKIRRLIITLPPRNLKSISASVAFPAFILGHDPRQSIVCVSYASELAAKHARDCKAVMQSDWYGRIFPTTRLSRDKNAELDFVTTKRGFRLATSVGGTLTGRGGNFIILDDPMKPDEAMSDTRRRSVCNWFDNTLYSRLDDKRSGVIIVVMQRLHVNDLIGHILAKEDWVTLNLPGIAEIDETVLVGPDRWHRRKKGDALNPQHEPLSILETLKRVMGSANFLAQYQQQPVPPDGGMVKWGWFRTYKNRPVNVTGDRIVQSWDTAAKGDEIHDYAVCTTWLVRGSDYYLIDVFRQQLDYPDLKRAVTQIARNHRPNTILIEDKAAGIQLIQELKRDTKSGICRPIAIKPLQDKETRLYIQAAVIEAGHVLIPDRATWLGDFQTELLQFPQGRYDDQVDSLTQFLGWITARRVKRRVTKLTGH